MKRLLISGLIGVCAFTMTACGKKTVNDDNLKELPQLNYIFNTQETHAQIAEILQSNWKELGFDVSISNQEWGVFQSTRTEGNFEIARNGWLSDYNDPNGFLEIFTSDNPLNVSKFKNETFDALMEQAAQTLDSKERMKLLHEAEQVLIDSHAIAPIMFYADPVLQQNNVEGAVHDPLLGSLFFTWAVKADGTPIKYDLGAKPKSLDPHLSTATNSGYVIQNVFEGLVKRGPENELLPGMAEKWEVSEDGKTYTFFLRDANWSDGKKVTADDFVYALNRLVDPNTQAEYANNGYILKNAKEINNGNQTEALGVRAEAPNQLVIELVNPLPYFIEVLTHPVFYPVRQDIVENSNWANQAQTYIGNGPYKMTEFNLGSHITLVKNDEYYDANNVACPTLELLLNDDDSAKLMAFENGEMDYHESPPPGEIDRMREKGQFAIHDNLGTYYLSFNTETEALSDPVIREALSLAINREQIAELAHYKYPAYSFVSHSVKDYDGSDFRTNGGNLFGEESYEKNVEKAKRILHEAGYRVPGYQANES